MCGVCGIILTQNTHACEYIIEQQLSTSLNSLKHRGYDGCGIVIDSSWDYEYGDKQVSTLNSTRTSRQDYVGNLCRRRVLSLESLHSNANNRTNISNKCDCETNNKKCTPISGIAHTRYKTAGECILKNTQPVMNKDGSLAMVHNGQVEVYKPTNYKNIENSGSLENMFDSMYILEVFERAYKQTKSVFRSVKTVHDTVKGSYACIMLIKSIGIVAFRDTSGIRPLIFGSDFVKQGDNNPTKVFVGVFASESIVLDDLKYKIVRDVKPGETIFIDLKGNVRYANYTTETHIEKPLKLMSSMDFVLCGDPLTKYTPCLFEYIYLADEKSVIDGINVRRAREIMGELLSDKLKRFFGTVDVIAPIPNTPVTATKILAHKTGIKYVDLLYLPTLINSHENNDSRNIIKKSRTFILPTQNKREMAVRDKFRINVENIIDCQDKVLALVDDSIVRGTTMKIIVKMIRELVQPKKLILVSLSPIIRYENVYGIDIPNRTDLIAHNRTLKEIAVELGADEVVYGDLDTITNALRSEAQRNGVYVDGYESSVFRNK